MFCGKCGTQIPDGVAFCPSCGNASGAQAPVNNENQPVNNEAQFTYGAPQPKKSNTGLIAAIAGVAIVVAVAIILICVFAGGGSSGASSPEDIVLTYMEATLDGDIEAVVDCLPEEFVDYMIEEEYDGDREAFMEEGEEAFESMIGMLSGLDVDYEVVEVEEGDDDEVDAWIEEFEDHYDIKLDITAVASVEVEATMSGSVLGQEINNTSSEEISVIKIDGKWYIHPESVNF